jgi:tetratricopeptide (TPR) repeat protein
VTPAALRELEKRLKSEPDNVGLRVAVAGALHDAGRHAEAVELYRSVAIVYRDQGRTQQAIAVCRSILEIAPDDRPCQSLLATLAPPPRRSSYDETPLPGPLPYHVADPTTRSLKKLSSPELDAAKRVSQPELDGTFTLPEIKAIGTRTEKDLVSELETRKRPRIEKAELAKIAQPPPEFDEDETTNAPVVHDTEEEVTVPRDETGKPLK